LVLPGYVENSDIAEVAIEKSN
jgi:hypothetical protein